MTEEQADLLSKAAESIGAARLLASSGYSAFAASRAYYAMFYVAQAYLEGEGLSFSKHSSVISAFGAQFAKTGKVPAEYHRYLIDARGLRLSGDYGESEEVAPEAAAEQITRAQSFLELARRQIGADPSQS